MVVLAAADLPRQPDGPGSSQTLSNGLSQPDVERQQQQHNQQQYNQQQYNQQLPVQQQQESEQQQISQQQHSQQRPDQHLGTIHENNAEQVSETFTLEIAEMRHRLKPSGAQAATDHFSDTELLRHARACGLLKVNRVAKCLILCLLRKSICIAYCKFEQRKPVQSTTRRSSILKDSGMGHQKTCSPVCNRTVLLPWCTDAHYQTALHVNAACV